MERVIKIPIEISGLPENGFHLFMKAGISGVPLRMLIDTGASNSVIDRGFLQRNFPQITLHNNGEPAIGAGSIPIDASVAEIRNFSVSSFTLRKYAVAVLDLSHVNEGYSKFGLAPLQGVVGCDFLMRFKATISVNKGWLKLRK